MGIFILVFSFYIMPIILSYLFVRSIIVEDEREPDYKDALLIFIPVINIFFGFFQLLNTFDSIAKSNFGKNILKKFFMVK